MRYYETFYIVNPNYEQERLDKVLLNVGKELEKENVKIINHRIWGKKRLAYPIQKHKYGTYVLLQYEGEDFSFLKEFDTFLKLDKAIIRYQTIRLKVRPQKQVEVVEDKTDTKSVKHEAKNTEIGSNPDVITENPEQENINEPAEAPETVTEISEPEEVVSE